MTPEQTLHDAIEGQRGFSELGAEQRSLVRLAWDVRRIEAPGPGAAALDRMTARFDRFLIADPSPAWKSWLAGWLGQGGMPRPVAQRLAAAGLLVGAMGFGGAAATGTSPEQVITGIASFAANAVENLSPRGGGGDAGPALEPSETPANSPTPSPTADGTPSPTGSAGAGVGETPGGTGTPSGGGVPGTGTETPPANATVTRTPTSHTGTLIPPTTAQPTASPTTADDQDPGESPTAATSTPTAPVATPSTSATPTGTVTTTPTAGGGFTTQSYSAGPAGSVVLRYSATTLEVVSVAPTAGWKYGVSDVENLSLKVEFEGNGQKIVFRATLQNGAPVTSFAEDHGEEESSD